MPESGCVSHLMKQRWDGATSRSPNQLFPTHSSEIGVARAAGIQGIQIEIHVVGLCALGNPLNDAGEDCVIRIYCGVDVSYIPRRRIDNVRDLIYDASLQPAILQIRKTRPQRPARNL